MRFMLMVKAGANYEAGRPPDPDLLAAIGALGRPLARHELAILLPWGSETDSAHWKTQGDWSPHIINLGDAEAAADAAEVRAAVASLLWRGERPRLRVDADNRDALGTRDCAIPTTVGFIGSQRPTSRNAGSKTDSAFIDHDQHIAIHNRGTKQTALRISWG